MSMSTARQGKGPLQALVNLLTSMGEGWNRFWFTPADPTLLGLLRIFAGLVTLYVHLAYTVDLQELLGRHAWIDQQTMQWFRHDWNWYAEPSGWEVERQDEPYALGYHGWSVWYHVTDPSWMMAVHIGILVVMFLFTIGFCTRITSVLTWLGAVSYIQRAPTSLFGMDTMMNLVLLYLMIGPSGAAMSVDRLIGRWWTVRRALRSHQPVPASLRPEPLISANLALRLIQLNLCIIYFVSGLSKLRGDTWWNGTAIWLTLANPEFSPIHSRPFLLFLDFLCQHRWLWEIVMNGGVLLTFFVEICFLFLVWGPRTRWVMMAAAFMMHTGIALSMGLTTFSMFMIVMVFSFTPPEVVQRLLDWLGGKREQLRLAFLLREPRQVRLASLVRAVDAWDQVVLVPSGSGQRTRHQVESPVAGPASQAIQASVPPRPKQLVAESPYVRLMTEAGEVLTGWALFERLTRSLRLLWPLFPVAWTIRRIRSNRQPNGGPWSTGKGEPKITKENATH